MDISSLMISTHPQLPLMSLFLEALLVYSKCLNPDADVCVLRCCVLQATLATLWWGTTAPVSTTYASSAWS